MTLGGWEGVGRMLGGSLHCDRVDRTLEGTVCCHGVGFSKRFLVEWTEVQLGARTHCEIICRDATGNWRARLWIPPLWFFIFPPPTCLHIPLAPFTSPRP